jgi:hypothetical protein
MPHHIDKRHINRLQQTKKQKLAIWKLKARKRVIYWPKNKEHRKWTLKFQTNKSGYRDNSNEQLFIQHDKFGYTKNYVV